MSRRTFYVLTGAFACSALSLALAQSSQPKDVAERFYKSYIAERPSGVPDEKTIATLAPSLTIELQGALIEAGRAEKRYAAKQKEPVPPLAEGDIFSSLFEGPTSALVRDCVFSATTGSCVANLTYDDKTQKPTVWRDEIRLRLVNDSWAVDDIVYGGAWDFARHGTLRETLADIVRAADQP